MGKALTHLANGLCATLCIAIMYGVSSFGMLGSAIASARKYCNQAGMLTNGLGTCRYSKRLTVACSLLSVPFMLRLPANTIRPLFNPTLLRSSLRRAPALNSRFFSNGLVQCVRREPSKLQISLARGSRTIMTDRPIVQEEANNFSWKKLAMTAVSDVPYMTFQLF